jgi:hypothetical protein
VAGGENEADARDAGEHGIGGGGEDVSGIGAEFEGVAVKALIEVDGGGEGALECGDAVGSWRQGFAGQEDDGGGGLLGVMDAVAAQEVFMP